MSVPYALVIIKPMSVGRKDAPEILDDLLTYCPVSLRRFRSWTICQTTLFALSRSVNTQSDLDYDLEKIHPSRGIDSWMGVFTHIDRVTDPVPLLQGYCGPIDHTQWQPHHLRHRYGRSMRSGNGHLSDTVVHIPNQERVFHEANMLFLDFTEETI